MSMRIGPFTIDPVRDGRGFEDARAAFTRPSVEDPWACHRDVLDDHGRIVFEMGGFLLRDGERVILVDTGVGSFDTDGLQAGGFLDSLAVLGVRPDDVTDVLLTHLHYDHVGWSTTKGSVVFGNATYRAHRDDWMHFVEAGDAVPGAVRKLRPLEPRLDLFDHEHTIAPGLDARPAPGHTPGSTIYILSGEGQRGLLLGDVVHTVAELAEPDWEAVYDVNPQQAQAVRNAVADEVCDTGTLIAPAHFPQMAWGRVVTTDEGRRWFPVS